MTALPDGTYEGVNFRMRYAYASKAARDAALERLGVAYYRARNAYLDARLVGFRGSSRETRLAQRCANALRKWEREQDRPYAVEAVAE